MPGFNWQDLYSAALAETNPYKLNGRIETARRAIHERSKELEGSGTTTREHEQLERALQALFTLAARRRSA
jgi:hypothetical protein